MDWTLLAFLGAFIISIVVIIEKRLISVNIKNIGAYYIWIAIAQLTMAGLVYLLLGLPNTLQTSTMITAYGGGLSYGIGVSLFVVGIKFEEASKTVAIIQTFPIFVTILAVNFLGEHISISQQISIVVIVSGAYLISLKKLSFGAVFRPTKVLPVLILASFSIGFAFFCFKIAFQDTTVSVIYIFRCCGIATILLSFFRPSMVSEMLSNIRHAPTRNLIFLTLFILVPTGTIAQLKATNLGPVSLVTSIVCTSPIIVFLLTAILTKTKLRALGEPIQRGTLILKGGAMCLVVAGLIGLQLL